MSQALLVMVVGIFVKLAMFPVLSTILFFGAVTGNKSVRALVAHEFCNISLREDFITVLLQSAAIWAVLFGLLGYAIGLGVK